MEQRNLLEVIGLLNRRIVPVYIFSTMRSGSTLLKSLLATASDISHMPEVNFQRYNRWNSWKIKLLSDKRIIILKQPAAYHDINYPKYVELNGLKKIVLVRDVFDNVISLMNMNAIPDLKIPEIWNMNKLVNDYWYRTYESILEEYDPLNTILVRYEDLVNEPIVVTSNIFDFLGSNQISGVDSYDKPEDFSWKWGEDDGGDQIKTLRVQNYKSQVSNPELMNIIKSSAKVLAMRERLGYSNNH